MAAGRPEAPNSDRGRPLGPSVLAVEVGSSFVRVRVVDRTGAVRRSEQIPAPTGVGDIGAVDAIRALVRGCISPGRPGSVVAAAVAVPGLVDSVAGVARYSADYGWHNLPLAELISAEIGAPVVLESRVRAAALAEGCSGAARSVANWLYLCVGAEIAAASTVAGSGQRGATGGAGEFGHLPIYPFGLVCGCGQRGCVQAYASTAAMSGRVQAVSGRSATVAEIATRVGRDPLADEVWQQAIAALGLALTTYTMIEDPELVVIGGELAEVAALALPSLRTDLRQRLLWRQPPRIEAAALGSDAVLTGALSLAWTAADRIGP